MVHAGVVRIEDVRTFLEVAATGSFSTAAAGLFVTQSTVSARISALEDALDRRLFVRGRSGAQLTAAGSQFQWYALTLVQAWQRAQQEVALPPGYVASLGLGTQVSLWRRLVPAWVPWMRERAPDVALRIEANYSDTMMDMLSSGLLHIAVMYQPRASPGFAIEALLEERLVMVSTRPRRLASGWPEDYLYINWGELFRAWHGEAFPHIGAPVVSFGLGEMALACVLEQGGTCYLEASAVEPLLAQRRLVLVEDAPTFARPAYMVYPERGPGRNMIEVGLEGLRQTFKKDRIS